MNTIRILLCLAALLCTGLAAQAQTRITNAAELAAIGQNTESLKGSYILTNDLTLENWLPIGGIDDRDGTGFSGTFDGGGHTVTITGLGDAGGGIALGLFGSIDEGGMVKNLRVAGNVGYTATRKNMLYIGGIAGVNQGTILCCCSDIILNGVIKVDGKGEKVKTFTGFETSICGGGITGVNLGLINDCYSTGSVSVSGGIRNFAGGIAGANGKAVTGSVGISVGTGGVGVSATPGVTAASDLIRNCYSTASVSIDESTVSGIYHMAGGIAGSNNPTGTISSCVALNDRVIANGKVNIYAIPISAVTPMIASITFNSFYDQDMAITRYKNGKEEKSRGYSDKNAVAASAMQEQAWWRYPDGLTGKQQAQQFGFLFGGDEKAPWVWDAEAKRPVLYWERPGSYANGASTEP